MEVKEWFYWPGGDGVERAGPLSKDEIKHFFHRGKARPRWQAEGVCRKPAPQQALLCGDCCLFLQVSTSFGAQVVRV